MRRVSGQMRLMDKSSARSSQFNVVAKNKDGGPVPDMKLQEASVLKKDASRRGRGEGVRGEVSIAGHDLLKGSTFKNPHMFQSVGFMRTTNSNIERIAHGQNVDMDKFRGGIQKLTSGRPMDKDMKEKVAAGMRRMPVAKPARKGKKDGSGKHLPAKKEHVPPKKVSDLITKEVKKVNKRKVTPATKKGRMSKVDKVPKLNKEKVKKLTKN